MRDNQDAVGALRRKDRKKGDLAEVALIEMLGARFDIGKVSRLHVCEFLWYVLPHKRRVRPALRSEIVDAVRQLFELAGLDRYAAICTSPQTAAIFRAYDERDELGVDAYQKAIHASGIVAPDTENLAWGRYQGRHERAAALACSAMLEHAVDARQLEVGKQGWQTVQAQLTDHWLLIPQISIGGRSWFEQIQSERIERWAEGGGLWGTSSSKIAPLLAREVPMPMEAFPVVHWFLDKAADGIPLTERHYVKPALVEEAVDRFWPDHGDLRNETDVPAFTAVKEILHKPSQAVRRTGRKLVLTPIGRKMRAQPDTCWRVICSGLIGSSESDEPDLGVAARTAAMIAMLAEDLEPETAALVPAVRELLLSRGWQDRNVEPAFTEGIRATVGTLTHLLDAMGLVGDERSRAGSRPTLDDVGRAAAYAALRAVAVGPRHQSYDA